MRQRDILAYAQKRLDDALRIVQTGGYATALPDLTPADKAFLYHYSDTGYESLNAGLHANPGTLSDFGRGLITVLTKLPLYEGEAYSGAYLNARELGACRACALSGSPFTWPAFLSASLREGMARQFLSMRQKNCLFVMQSRTGRLIEAVAKYGLHGPAPGQNEREVLFMPQTRFEVLAVDDEPDYTRIVLDQL